MKITPGCSVQFISTCPGTPSGSVADRHQRTPASYSLTERVTLLWAMRCVLALCYGSPKNCANTWCCLQQPWGWFCSWSKAELPDIPACCLNGPHSSCCISSFPSIACLPVSLSCALVSPVSKFKVVFLSRTMSWVDSRSAFVWTKPG